MSISRIDLAGTPVVDNHAHPLTRAQPASPEELRRHFTEAPSPLMARQHVEAAVPYRWAMRQLAQELGVEPSAEGILQRREQLHFEPYARDLVRRAGLAYLLLDDGYPPRHEAYSVDEMGVVLGVPVRRILRLETLVQDLIAGLDSFQTVVDRFDAAILEARRNGCVSLKSIAAYRTGLRIERAGDEEAARAFDPVKRAASEGRVRLTSKPLIDYFVWRGVRQAAIHGLPIQFHTGYGDPDLDLRLANPLHLRPLFEDAALRSVPIVLLHESFPFTAEAAFLCAVYPNAYLDLAFSLPPLSRTLLRRAVDTALGVAPASKLLCSSDGTAIPEHYWLGAVRAREILSEALTEIVAGGEIDQGDAEEIGRMVLHDNAVRLYDLPTS